MIRTKPDSRNPKTRRTSATDHRRGAIAVLAAVMLVVMVAFVAFAVDLGRLMVVRTELQRTADAAALAAAWSCAKDTTPQELMAQARSAATEYVSKNKSGRVTLSIDANADNAPDGDIVIGTLEAGSVNKGEMTFFEPASYNAVLVRVGRNARRNGEVPLFFASLFGLSSCSVHASATAMVIKDVRGFRSPRTDERLPILPIALHIDSWNTAITGITSRDEWRWDDVTATVVKAPDTRAEIRLYPETSGSPGNFGTVNIGGVANSTSHISKQIREGVSQADLDYHGGDLTLNENGQLFLTGDTGISAGIKDELEAIRGQTRIVPVYQTVEQAGNNAVYEIVKFVGVRIMWVKLTGPNAELIVQPADVVTSGAIASVSGGQSEFIYSPSRLVR